VISKTCQGTLTDQANLAIVPEDAPNKGDNYVNFLLLLRHDEAVSGHVTVVDLGRYPIDGGELPLW
jgi:hypothetical protein